MTLNRKLLTGLVLIPLSLLGLPAAPVFAEENGGTSVNETQVLMNAKISIADAIRVAEAEAKGKAIDSGLNDENGEVSYQVEVVGQDGKRTDVFVDLQSGKVVKMAAADADEEAKGEEENDEGNGNKHEGEDNEEGND